MINLRITMVSGQTFNIRNFAVDSINDFLRMVLMKNQTQVNWYEVIPGTFIQASLIEGITQLSNVELENINNPKLEDGNEVVFDEDKDNEEFGENVAKGSD